MAADMMDLVAIWRRHHATDWAKKNIRRDEATLANGDINKVAPYPMVTLAPKPGLARVRSMLNAIHHVALICTDYDRSRRFYVELLGLDLIREIYREERQSWKADLRIGSAQLELFSFPAPVMRPSYPEATGLRHLAFTVVNLDPVIMRLEAAGIAVEPIRIDPYTDQRFTFFSDPDGLPLELYEDQ